MYDRKPTNIEMLQHVQFDYKPLLSLSFIDEEKSNRKKKSKEQKRLEETAFLSKLFTFSCQIISR